MTRVILDCDPGIDDALALIYLTAAHHEGAIELEAVTTSAGNVGAHQCAVNAAWVLTLCGLRAMAVGEGMSAPLAVDLVTTPETHGATGLGYVDAPPRHVEDDWDMLWRDAISRGTDDLHLIVTGPLTNLAAFRRMYPEDFSQLKHITVMGGAVGYPGNTTETAEWNFWVDPDAAAEVLRHPPAPVALYTLGVTEQMLLTPDSLAEVVSALGPAPVAAQLPEMLRFYFEFHEQEELGYLAQVHDLLTVMGALGTVPTRTRAAAVTVHARDDALRGTSVETEGEPNVMLVADADIDAAHREFLRACDVHARFFGGNAELDAARHARAED